MAKLTWTEELAVGHLDLDYQHKMLIGYINNLEQAIEDESSRIVFELIFDNLVSYAKNHFHTEEVVMQEFHFPEFDRHLILHSQFFQTIANFRTKFDANENVERELLAYLEKWIVDHIKKEDKKYCPFIRE